MKSLLPTFAFGGFVVTIILLGTSFALTSLQNQKIQKQLADLNQKIDKVQAASEQEIIKKLIKLEAKIPESLTEKPITDTAATDSDDVLSPANLAKTLGASSTKDGTKVKLKETFNNINVYETTKSTSRVTGQITVNNYYSIIERRPEWYLIVLDPKTNAWVQSQYVYETN